VTSKFFSGAPLSLTQRLADEAKHGTLDLTHEPVTSAIPAPAGDANLKKTIGPIKAWIDQASGATGSVLDKHLTLRDLMAEGAVAVRIGSTIISGTDPSAIDLGSGYSDPRPVYAIPPTPTNLTAQGAFKNVILHWDLISYANFAYTEVYRSATNARGAAILIGTSTSNLYADANVTVGSTYYYWVRAINQGGAYGSDNAVGGTSAALLTIGNTDLGDLVVSAEKLSSGTYPNINLVPNGGAEDVLGTQPVGWAIAATYGAGGTFSYGNSAGFAAGGSNYFRIQNAGAANTNAVGCLAFPVIPGETYSVKVRVQGSSASAAGLYVQMLESATKPVGGYVNGANYTTFQNLVADGAIANTWTLKEFTYVPTAGTFWVSLAMILFTTSTSTNLYWDDVSVGRQITASFLAANSIAVGTAAIQNAAIVNAMIANLAVDSAKIAALAVTNAKIGLLAVDTAQINALAVTTAKIALLAVTNAQIANATIGTAQINTLNASVITAGTITTDRLINNAVTDITSTSPADGTQTIGHTYAGPATSEYQVFATASYTNTTGAAVTLTWHWSMSAAVSASGSGWTGPWFQITGSGTGWPGGGSGIIPISANGTLYSGTFSTTLANGNAVTVNVNGRADTAGSATGGFTVPYKDVYLALQAVKK
jgi:hypothetical protein